MRIFNPLPPSAPAPGPRRFSSDEYHRLAEVGILQPDDRVELIDGMIHQMAPIGRFHRGHTNLLARWFERLSGEPPRWIVQVQSPVMLADGTEPVPDLALLREREDFYLTGDDLAPADVYLVVEVADTSLRADRTTKATAYARAGIVEYWILNLPESCVEVHRQPDPAAGRYAAVSRVAPGETLCLVAFPEVAVPVARLLGPA